MNIQTPSSLQHRMLCSWGMKNPCACGALGPLSIDVNDTDNDDNGTDGTVSTSMDSGDASGTEETGEVALYVEWHDKLLNLLIEEATKESAPDDVDSARNVTGGASNNMDNTKGIPSTAKRSDSRNARGRRTPRNKIIPRNSLLCFHSRARPRRRKKIVKARSEEKQLNGSTSTLSKNREVKEHNILYKFLHQDCELHKERRESKSSRRSSTKSSSDDSIGGASCPSAVGRDATLLKLNEKLSVLSKIESGKNEKQSKFGKGGELIRSDVVGFVVSPSSTASNKQLAAVETRSLLTFKMGLVSLSYGVLLQWDCKSQSVVLIALHKMCKKDFLERKGYPTIESAPKGSKQPVSCSKVKGVRNDSRNSNSSVGSSNGTENSTPQVSALSTNFLSKIFGEPTHSNSPQPSLNICLSSGKDLTTVCDHCKNAKNPLNGTISSLWPFGSQIQADKGTLSASDTSQNSTIRKVIGCNSKPKQAGQMNDDSMQLYVRFILGQQEHRTKLTKANRGNPKWSKGQNNSCVLPIPTDSNRWFAKHEDRFLTVEVWSQAPCSPSSTTPVEDRVFAVAKLPLSTFTKASSEAMDPDSSSAEGFKSHPSRVLCTRKSTGGSSKLVNVPMFMKCCPTIPCGLICLEFVVNDSSV